jgi:hypothetical protein
MNKRQLGKLRKQLTAACEYAIHTLGLKITSDTFGVWVDYRRVDGPRFVPNVRGCCCPIGALQLFLQKGRRDVGLSEYEIDEFVDAFDHPEANRGYSPLRALARELSERYIPDGRSTS